MKKLFLEITIFICYTMYSMYLFGLSQTVLFFDWSLTWTVIKLWLNADLDSDHLMTEHWSGQWSRYDHLSRFDFYADLDIDLVLT